jgi:hypothetical protein
LRLRPAAGYIDQPLVTYNFSSVSYSTVNREIIENRTKIEIEEQIATFPNGINFTLRVERFNSSLDRSYFGWRQKLAPRNVKITYLVNGVNQSSLGLRPSRLYQIGISFRLSVQLQVDPAVTVTNSIFDTSNISTCDYDNVTGVPLVFCGSVKFSEAYGAVPPEERVRFLQLDIFEQRGKFRAIQQLDSTCINAAGRNFYTLRTARFQDPEASQEQSYSNTVQQILSLYLPPYPNVVSFNGLISFGPDDCNATSFEYDPDLSGIFFLADEPAVLQTPAEMQQQQVENSTGIIVGAVVGSVFGAAVVALIVMTIVSPSIRQKIFPFFSTQKKSTELEPIDEHEPGKKRQSSWVSASAPQK